MNYVVKPSLEHIALVKVAALLWNQNDVRNLITSFSFPPGYLKLLRTDLTRRPMEEEIITLWNNIEEHVVNKVVELPLPQLLKDKISNLIKVVGLNILNWLVFHYKTCGLQVSLPNEFHWTAKGTIDEMKTAEVLIKDERIDVATRYKLSCIYCSENDVLKLFNEMPEDCRSLFYSEVDPMDVEQYELITVWTYDIKGEIAKVEEMIESYYDFPAYAYALYFAAISGNKIATGYFLQKLTSVISPEMYEFIIYAGMNAAGGFLDTLQYRPENQGEKHSEVLCTLLSQMDEEQQMKVFKEKPLLVLCCLLEWPFQVFFMETANRMWSVLSVKKFAKCLIRIASKMYLHYRDYDYKQLFKQFWEQSPNSYKRQLLSSKPKMYRAILSILFTLDDADIVKFFYQDATIQQKIDIIYHGDSMKICSYLITFEQWNLLNLFITESLPTIDMMIKFKRDFEEKELWTFSDESCEMEFRHILNDIICEFSQRKRTDNEHNPIKRHRTDLKKIVCIEK